MSESDNDSILFKSGPAIALLFNHKPFPNRTYWTTVIPKLLTEIRNRNVPRSWKFDNVKMKEFKDFIKIKDGKPNVKALSLQILAFWMEDLHQLLKNRNKPRNWGSDTCCQRIWRRNGALSSLRYICSRTPKQSKNIVVIAANFSF